MELQRINSLIEKAEQSLNDKFKKIDEVALINFEKVLNSFKKNKVSANHFNFSTGYGYDDIGKNTLSKIFSDIFKTETSLVSPNIASGTHAISIALFGLLYPNDELISISGAPYDTLIKTIKGKNVGSLADYNVSYKEIPLLNNNFDYERIMQEISIKTKVIFVGRSRGYEWRDAISIEQIEKVCTLIKSKYDHVIIVTDNCYGEFVNTLEPTEVGADVAIGSLIKNIGGGLAVCGGYITGKEEYINKIASRLTSPSIGFEVGSYYAGYLSFYQGLFMAPTTVKNALKGSALFSKVYEMLGYEVIPSSDSIQGDIITSIKLNNEDKLLSFIRSIQYNSPVDSYVTPYPWDMPGYDYPVAMAAGTFIQGASIELSCDSPIKPPYIAYVQGGLTYEHIKTALKECLKQE